MSSPVGGAKQFGQGSKCSKCKEDLGLKAISTGTGLFFHRECFKCAGCQQPLEMRFHDVDGQQFCYKCYTDKYAPKCAECKKALDGTLCVVMMGKEFHAQCPKCSKCRKSLAGGQYFPFHDQPYCLECHWKVRVEASKSPKTNVGVPGSSNSGTK